MRIGYARCSTDAQDLTAQRQALAALGCTEDRIYLDHGFTGRNRARPALKEALAAVRDGDVFVVTKLDRLARSVPDATSIISDLASRNVGFAMGGSTYDWNDPFGQMFLSMIAVFAEFEVNVIRMRTREGMAVARSKGRLRGKQPKLSARQQAELVRQHATGDYSVTELAELYSISRPAVYRTLDRAGARNQGAARA
jgi:DNA invertase Pin-like site-specific DNA recombinase